MIYSVFGWLIDFGVGGSSKPILLTLFQSCKYSDEIWSSGALSQNTSVFNSLASACTKGDLKKRSNEQGKFTDTAGINNHTLLAIVPYPLAAGTLSL